MEQDKKVIYPMMIGLDQRIISKVYYVALPREVKDKWIELEQKAKSNYNPLYNLPTITLKTMLCTYMDGVINMKSVKGDSEDSKWIISFKDINIKVLVNCFKIWVNEFYINGVLTKDYKRRNGADERVKTAAEELMQLLTPEKFGKSFEEEVIIFNDGKNVDNEGFQLYPLKIVNSLMGKEIIFRGTRTKLLYSNSNELVTNPHDLCYKGDYYSMVIRLSVQTLPPDNKAYLNVDLSVRRWVSRSFKTGDKMFFRTDKNCYIRVKEDRLQSIKTEYKKELGGNSWKKIDCECFKESQVESSIPEFLEVMDCPGDYNRGEIGDVLVPYQEGMDGTDTFIKAGVSFDDRIKAFEIIKDEINKLDGITSVIEAKNVDKLVRRTRRSFFFKDDKNNIDSSFLLEQIEKALDGEKLTIEIYAAEEIEKAFVFMLTKYFKDDPDKYEIKVCDRRDLSKDLEITPESNADNLIGFEMKKNDIIKELRIVNKPTLALIEINDKEYYANANRKINIDPKAAIRSGFAETGRLTQFITSEEFEAEKNRIENYIKEIENGKSNKHKNRSENINRAVFGSVWDGFRQLGVVYDYSSIGRMKGQKVVGIHVCNYKKTHYGSIAPFPVIVTYDVQSSRMYAYCELVDKVDLPYWRCILGISKLAGDKNIYQREKERSSNSLYRRLERIINKSDDDVIVIIDADGTSRKLIKGIANSEIDKTEKTRFSQVSKLLVNDDKCIDFSECKNKLYFMRIRHNGEVPTYFTMDEGSEKRSYSQSSGIFKYDEVYYSLDNRPMHESKSYDKARSKTTDTASFSHRNLIEIYPMFVTGDESTIEINRTIGVSIVDMLRGASIQYTTQKTVLPLPLHLAEKMEEYI